MAGIHDFSMACCNFYSGSKFCATVNLNVNYKRYYLMTDMINIWKYFRKKQLQLLIPAGGGGTESMLHLGRGVSSAKIYWPCQFCWWHQVHWLPIRGFFGVHFFVCFWYCKIFASIFSAYTTSILKILSQTNWQDGYKMDRFLSNLTYEQFASFIRYNIRALSDIISIYELYQI